MVGAGCEPQKLLGTLVRRLSQAATDGTDRVPAGHEARLLDSSDGVLQPPGEACGDGDADAHGLSMQIGCMVTLPVPGPVALNRTMPVVE